MNRISLAELSGIFGAELQGDPQTEISGFATDSGEVKPGDLFIAIQGARVDGHDFVPSALDRGAHASLVDRPVNGPCLIVPDVIAAIARMGSHFRSTFTGPVIGITGSAGKTTTKEFLAAALSPLGEVLKSPGNRNTEITSPLVWADLTATTKVAVIEMAMRGFGQIKHLANIARPQLGIVTNIGYAHLLQVKTREGIAQAKGELLESLPPDGTAILWGECEFLETLRAIAGTRKVRTFGFSDGCDCHITSYKSLLWDHTVVRGTCGGLAWKAELKAAGRHVALDAAAAILTASELAIPASVASEQLSAVGPPPMRMEVRKFGTIGVILDSYNASPPSMISALETIADAGGANRKLALLGEMRELGDLSEQGHREVGRAIRVNHLDKVLLVGPDMRFALEEVGPVDATWVEKASEAREWMGAVQNDDLLLVKGSRALQLEDLLEALTQS